MFTGYFPSSMCNLRAIGYNTLTNFDIAGNMFWCPFPSQCAYALENTAVRACVRACVWHACTHACMRVPTLRVVRSFVRSFVPSFVLLIGQCVDMPRSRGRCRCRCRCVRVDPDHSYPWRACVRARVWSVIFVGLRAAAKMFCREESASAAPTVPALGARGALARKRAPMGGHSSS